MELIYQRCKKFDQSSYSLSNAIFYNIFGLRSLINDPYQRILCINELVERKLILITAKLITSLFNVKLMNVDSLMQLADEYHKDAMCYVQSLSNDTIEMSSIKKILSVL